MLRKPAGMGGGWSARSENGEEKDVPNRERVNHATLNPNASMPCVEAYRRAAWDGYVLSGPSAGWGMRGGGGEKGSGRGTGDGLLHDVVRKVISQILDIAALLLRERGSQRFWIKQLGPRGQTRIGEPLAKTCRCNARHQTDR